MRHLREGSLPTYQLAFLMTEYLIQRDGFPRLVGYFAAAAQSRDRRENFRRAFGQSFEQFEEDILEHLQTLVSEAGPGAPLARAALKSARPRSYNRPGVSRNSNPSSTVRSRHGEGSPTV